jgi:PilZ domain
VAAARPGPLYSRRLIPRVETSEGLWVCWRCAGVEDVSRVRDLSVAGLFLSTAVPRPLGARARLDFLVPEGQIRAEAIVQHHVPSGGLGLKFTAITDQDCPRLVALMDRICSQPPPSVRGAKSDMFPFQVL